MWSSSVVEQCLLPQQNPSCCNDCGCAVKHLQLSVCPPSMSLCVCVCVCVCVHVLNCVFANSENVQTVYKVHKLMYCAIVHVCLIIVTLLVYTSIVCEQPCL